MFRKKSMTYTLFLKNYAHSFQSFHSMPKEDCNMEKRSLFYPLDQEGLTTLRIQYDWKTGNVFLQASKDWDEDFDWSRYNHDFYVESIKTRTARLLNDVETRAMYEKYGISDYLEEVIDLVC